MIYYLIAIFYLWSNNLIGNIIRMRIDWIVTYPNTNRPAFDHLAQWNFLMRSVDNHFDFVACVKCALRAKTVHVVELPAGQVPEENPCQHLKIQDIKFVSIEFDIVRYRTSGIIFIKNVNRI